MGNSLDRLRNRTDCEGEKQENQNDETDKNMARCPEWRWSKTFRKRRMSRRWYRRRRARQFYSFVPAEVAHFKNDPFGRMRALAKEPGRENVEAVSADLVAMPDVAQPADVVWLHLFYHDLHTALIQARGATEAGFNRAVHSRLKPAGVYVIVDHAAAPGAGKSDAQALHRIEPASVRDEVEASGFVLDAESAILAKQDDPHATKVFDPSIKGETDRFASVCSALTVGQAAISSRQAGIPGQRFDHPLRLAGMLEI